MPIPKLKANENRTFIYTDACKLCGHTAEYASLSARLQNLGKIVYVKQTPLWAGWANEAAEIGLEMPFVYDYDTLKSATVSSLNELSDDELRAWLGI